MRRNPTPTTFMLFIISFFFLLFSSCQKDSDLFAEAILDDPDPVVDGSDDGDDAEVEAATITLNAIDDAYIQDGEGINEGIVRVETNVRTTYLKFDLSSIEGTITGAYLEFTTDSDQGHGHLEAYKGTGNDWTEESLSLDNAPSQGELLGEVDSEYAVGFDQQIPLDSDLLTSSLLSIVLNIKSGNDIAIASKESPNNEGPRLVVEYMGKVNGNTQEDDENDDDIGNIVIDDVITLTDLKAFPSAFGAAAEITGGRGGTIYEVTNLNDSGPGSFRAAFEATGKRIIIVKVEGFVEKSSEFKNLQPGQGDVSIWGQFAPGRGITLSKGRFSWSNAGNIIVRHITAQNGDVNCTVNVSCYDALNIFAMKENTGFYIDHCSLRYGADQIFFTETRNAGNTSTMAYNVLAEAVPSHNTGVIFSDDFSDRNNGAGSHSFARNMFYNISHRFPNMKGYSGNFEIYNNYIVNWDARLSRNSGPLKVDWHDNYAEAGNKSKGSTPINKWGYDNGEWNNKKPTIYSSGNFIGGWDETPSSNQENIWVWFKSSSATVGNTRVVEDEPLDPSLFSSSKINNFILPNDGIWSYDQIPEKMNASVGHNRGINADGSPGFFRDDLDQEYLARSLSGTTPSRYREPSEWTNSSFTNTNMYLDSDGDHMPDWFENQHAHLNPNDPSDMLKTHVDWAFSDGYAVVNNAGYTNLEICAEYYAGGFETILEGTNDMNF
ncbi:DNRLRE domain-containing protein [Allomuricauda sp. CP2A]|uniref:CBM96 family carbohydrate-binding protein n=1 Tax=Allomuricauda sp. CP2A TaxID=1848189 RepID=UPI000829FF3D|nr:DNRLRE domain-containing protein [Muricauda sp. CP2A]